MIKYIAIDLEHQLDFFAVQVWYSASASCAFFKTHKHNDIKWFLHSRTVEQKLQEISSAVFNDKLKWANTGPAKVR